MNERLATALTGVHNFGELVAALHAIRYTGTVTLHLFNGHPQEAELGRPHVVVFPKLGPDPGVSTKPLDSGGHSPASSSP